MTTNTTIGNNGTTMSQSLLNTMNGTGSCTGPDGKKRDGIHFKL